MLVKFLNTVKFLNSKTAEFNSKEDVMSTTLEIAVSSAELGYGPFGAIIVDKDLKLVSYGYNSVVSNKDSTEHAEIVALRAAQRYFNDYSLAKYRCTLFTSAAPCIQCYGAIYWSGLSRVYSCVTKEDVESYGFQEGPVSEELWLRAKEDKNITYIPEFCKDHELSLKPFELYRNNNNIIY